MKNIFMGSTVINEDMQNIYNRTIDWERFRNQTILISGATGMLASYLVYFLIYLNERYNADIRIMVIVRNIEKCKRTFKRYTEKKYFRILTDDIINPLIINERVDYIIHAASLASAQYYDKMPIEVAAPNAIGTYHLLQLASKHHAKGFLFFSSGDVYGKIESAKDITEDMFGIIDPLYIRSCYGESKRMGETWCMAFAKEKLVPAKIVRICHTYGPTMNIEEDERVFSTFMKSLYYGEDIIMLSDGSAKRPFCYIADAVAAFFLVLLEGKTGEAYNVCNEDEFLSISELAELMIQLRPESALKIIKKEKAPSQAYLENKYNKENKPIADKLKNLGWHCDYNAYMGFKNVLRYLQENDKSIIV